ncbi:sugar transporter domain-containing protein [Ditylenchus destructor]|uniref:Sugar transporter domain-containing protein n=1 Tax=Ditylenchus destructor TaxID=166010 RepID=A0AAD4NEN4_9BILA|nr:sugar transporter domain-containing protein [Ditylenchus destructor]
MAQQNISIFAPNGSPFRIILYTVVISFLSNFYQASSIAYTNVAEENFKAFVKDAYIKRGSPISHASSGWLWSLIMNSILLGNFIGTICTPILVDNFGRRYVSLFGSFGMILATLTGAASILIYLPELLLISRIFGAVMSVESMPTKWRGTCFFIHGTANIFIVLFGMILGMNKFLGAKLFWLLVVGALPSLFSLLLLLPMRESPKFLLLHRNNKEEAIKSLKFYQACSDIDYEKLVEETIKEEANKETKRNIWKSLKKIFLERHLRKAVILGICALQLAIGIWTITTEVLGAHFPPDKAQTYASALFGVNFLAGFAGVYLVGRMSRRLLLIGSGAVNALSLTGYIISDRLVSLAGVIFFDYGCIISLFFYNLSYGVGFGIIVFYISSELLPQFHRSLGQSVVFCITIPISFCFSFVTLPAYEAYNVWAFIPLFILPSILALLYLYINLPETNGREIFETVEELKMTAKDRARNNALRN